MNAYHTFHVAENQKMNSMGYLGMISVPLPHQRPQAAAESQVGDVQDLQQPAFPCSTGRHQHCQATMLSLCRHYSFWSAVLRCQSGMQVHHRVTSFVECHSVMQLHCASQIAKFMVDTKDVGCTCLLHSHDSAVQYLHCCSSPGYKSQLI